MESLTFEPHAYNAEFKTVYDSEIDTGVDLPNAITKRTVYEVKVGKAVLGYKAMRRKLKKSKFNHTLGRMCEIEKLIQHRHGSVVPQTDDAHIYADVIASLALVEFRDDCVDYIIAWCSKWYPWAGSKFIDDVIFNRLEQRYRCLSADALGIRLHISYKERTLLDLRTIGSYDKTRSERKAIQADKRRKRDRERKASQRRARGAVPRARYLQNSLTRTMPWVAKGVSRRTWERERKRNLIISD